MKSTCLIPFALALVCSQDPPREPEPSLVEAARGVDRAWGENDADACLELMRELFESDMELFLGTPEVRGALLRGALLQMAESLRDYQGEPRTWTTQSESWFVGRDLAVRKGREKLSQLGQERCILTTSVFARRDGKWVLVHAHHSEYEPGG